MFGKLVRFGKVVNEVYTHYYYSTGWGDMCCGRSACELTKTFILFGFDDLDCVQSTLSKKSKSFYFFNLCVGAPPANPKKCLYFCIFIFRGRCSHLKSQKVFIFLYLCVGARPSNRKKCFLFLYFHICGKMLVLQIPQKNYTFVFV